MDFVARVWDETVALTLAAGPYLLLGFTLAGFVHVLLPARRVMRWLGGESWRSVTVAAAVGTPLPLCSCSVVPVAAELRRSGASRGATTAFLISTPETGVDSITLTYGLFDPLMTVARPIAAFLTALVGGLAQNWLNPERRDRTGQSPALTPQPSQGAGGLIALTVGGSAAPSPANKLDANRGAPSCCSHGPSPSVSLPVMQPMSPLSPASETKAPTAGWISGAKEALRYGWFKLFEDLALYLLLGLALAGLLSALLQQFDVLQQALRSAWAPVVMLAAGIPMYICASSATPLAAVLVSQGLSPGSALVLLLSGPATNAATILVLRQMLGRRGVAIYLTMIAACSLGAGWLLDSLYRWTGIAPAVHLGHEHGHHDHAGTGASSLWVMAFTGGFLLLLARGLWVRMIAPRFSALRAGSAPLRA